MNAVRRKTLAITLVCALAVTAAAPQSAQARPAATQRQAHAIGPIGGVTGGDAIAIGVAIVAIGAGIGFGIYFAFHHGHSLTGCAVTGANGLQLQNKGDQVTYSLVGAVATIKPGDRVRVSGKKVKKSVGSTPQFLVDNLSKDYGACPATP